MKQYVEDNAGAETEDEKEEVADAVKAMDRALEMGQWSMEEELYVGYHHQGPRMGFRGSGIWSGLETIAKVGIALSGFFGLKQFAGTGKCDFLSSGGKMASGG